MPTVFVRRSGPVRDCRPVSVYREGRTTMSTYVVVGAGLAGAATAWQLARRGHEVTVLERSTPANGEGSSHGSARIFRYGYTDPFYARLVVDSRVEWDELERLAGERLI